MKRALIVAATVVSLLVPSATRAQQPAGAQQPAAAQEPTGFTARASLTVQLNSPSGPVVLSGDGSAEARGTTVRLDLSRLASAADASAPGATNLAADGYGYIFEGATSTVTLWSKARRTYFVTRIAAPAGQGLTAPAAAPGSPFAWIDDLRTAALSISLVSEKAVVSGHPTSAIDFSLAHPQKVGNPVDVAGRLSFADDLGGVPILLVCKVTSGPPQMMGGVVQLALADVKATSPPPSDFIPPTGFARAASAAELFGM